MTRYKTDHQTRRIVRNASGQDQLFEKSYEEELEAEGGRPVDCLGLTFKNDDARRSHFIGKLREGLEELHGELGGVPFTSVDDVVARLTEIDTWPMGDEARLRKLADRMRHAESSKDLLERWKDEIGFPHGDIEDILALSDPPYYTACPNPFLGSFVAHCGTQYDPKTDDYHREPFAADVTEGKADSVYNAHSYHTKVPPAAIEHYLRHYTRPGDILLDCFCGSGMTGVATERLHQRHSVLIDLSPAACFVASNYTEPLDIDLLHAEATTIVAEVEAEFGSFFQTAHDHNTKGVIDYVIWSDILLCSECNQEIVFWDVAVDWELGKKGKIASALCCPHCDAHLAKRQLRRAFEVHFDRALGHPVERRKMVPVRLVYKVGRNSFEKQPDEADLQLVEQSSDLEINAWYPTDLFMNKEGKWGDLWRGYHKGFSHVHHFTFPRNLRILAEFVRHAQRSPFKRQLMAGVTAVLKYAGYQNRISPSSTMGLFRTMSGTLYLGSILGEVDVASSLRSRFEKKKLKAFYSTKRRASYISTSSATDMSELPNDSIDYVFVDPPFGDNLPYSELNFVWESWLRVRTRPESEAIVSATQQKKLTEYGHLMARSFEEIYRVLKPGRWMTVEFHNSKNAVWASIQEAMSFSGFVVADVRILDKGEVLTKKQFTSVNAVNKDLVISAYKPSRGLERRFELEAGTEDNVWYFLRAHLRRLPVFVEKDGRAETIAERQSYLLFDRMVAFHVQRGVTVPLSAAKLYAGLAQRFPERDGMYFLADQVSEYDKKRMTVREVLQLEIFVIDESAAIQWLKQQLHRKPQTFRDIHPQFLREIGGWQKHERVLELSELLEQNFLRYDGAAEVPNQVHSYLSTNFKELRKLPKDHPSLRTKAKDRWYVPDPNKAGDLERLREGALLREFEEYRQSAERRLKVFRLEAVRAGFKRAWQDRDYETIIAVAQKISEDVLQEDPKLLMWYDQAVTRTEAA